MNIYDLGWRRNLQSVFGDGGTAGGRYDEEAGRMRGRKGFGRRWWIWLVPLGPPCVVPTYSWIDDADSSVIVDRAMDYRSRSIRSRLKSWRSSRRSYERESLSRRIEGVNLPSRLGIRRTNQTQIDGF